MKEIYYDSASDVQGILTSSTIGCLKSIQAYLPVTKKQYRRLHTLYYKALELQKEIVFGEKPIKK